MGVGVSDGDGVGDAIEGNLISGNLYGVVVEGLGTDNTVIAGNHIGTNDAGAAPLANIAAGIKLSPTAGPTRIGTNADGTHDDLERNVISGNLGWMGLMIQNASDNVVAGNYIGTAANGTTALPNVGNGMDVKAGSQRNRTK